MTLKQLKKIFNTEFTPPFVPEDFVSCEWEGRGKKRVLSITIGPRDVQINEKGIVVGAGTCI